MVITGGSTTGAGGGIYNRENLTLINSTIGGNRANNIGGGIFNFSATANIENSTINNNSVGTRGGGLLVFSGSVSSISTTFFNNSGIGIDLVGGSENANFVTGNDLNDVDTGANGLQNFPLLVFSGSDVTVTLNSTANTNFLIQLFSNTTADPSGFGEGQVLVASETVTTNASSIANFTFTSPVGSNFTAPATRLDGSNNPIETSEFSAVLAVTLPTPTISIGSATITEGGIATFTASLSSASGQTVTANFSTTAGTAQSGTVKHHHLLRSMWQMIAL